MDRRLSPEFLRVVGSWILAVLYDDNEIDGDPRPSDWNEVPVVVALWRSWADVILGIGGRELADDDRVLQPLVLIAGVRGFARS